MMRKLTYYRRKRNEILSRDKWRCQKCGKDIRYMADRDNNPQTITRDVANIHHILDPHWDENDSRNKMTFCPLCHPAETGLRFWEWLERGECPRDELDREIASTVDGFRHEAEIKGFVKAIMFLMMCGCIGKSKEGLIDAAENQD